MLIPKPLQEEKYSYSYIKTKSDLISELKKVFAAEPAKDSNSLTGKFSSENEFYITSKNAVFFSDSGSSGNNSLKGKITASDGKVIIDVVVKPVPRIYIEMLAPLLFGLVYLCYSIFYSAAITIASLVYSGILIILIPLAVLFLGQASKDKLRNNVVKMLKLNKI